MGPDQFLNVVAALAHEVVHAHQEEHLNEALPPNGEYAALKADALSINAQRLIPFSEQATNNNAYVLQPAELQSHLIQNMVKKALQP